MTHDCDYKFFCEEIVQLVTDKENNVLFDSEFMETLWEKVEEIKQLLNVDAETENY